MTHGQDYTPGTKAVEALVQGGWEVLPELVRIVVNQAMKAERENYLQAEAYERTPDRQGQANGYKPKTVKTRIGEITFSVPQVREGGFYPSVLEKGLRSERALMIALAEMYVQGVSTRKVKEITEKMCGVEVSAMQVSRAAAKLDDMLQAWRERPLGEVTYLFLDARYEKVRENGQMRDAAVLIATGIDAEGRRQGLGVTVTLSEKEDHWRDFLKSLKERGLHGTKLVVSDCHEGLGAARRTVLGSIPWQRCQFHLQQNAQAYIPRKSMKEDVATDIRAIFQAADRQRAEALLITTVEKYADSAPKLATWIEDNLEQGLTVFDFPVAHQRFIRTSNSLERVNEEIYRRTRVVRIFPNEASCLRLVSALLMEMDEKWQTGKRCYSVVS